MTCTNFPSSGLVANVTTHQVGEILYKWTGSVWEAVSPPVDLGVLFAALPTYADDTSAGNGGLLSGEPYKTSTGEVRVKV